MAVGIGDTIERLSIHSKHYIIPISVFSNVKVKTKQLLSFYIFLLPYAVQTFGFAIVLFTMLLCRCRRLIPVFLSFMCCIFTVQYIDAVYFKCFPVSFLKWSTYKDTNPLFDHFFGILFVCLQIANHPGSFRYRKFAWLIRKLQIHNFLQNTTQLWLKTIIKVSFI
jgi:hypothetical protein